jgi:transcriptional regulator with XRE-family HTH domain
MDAKIAMRLLKQEMAPRPRDPYALEVGKRLRAARMAAGFSQTDFAKRLKLPAAGNLSNWEHGIAMVPPHYALKIFQLLRVDSNFLYLGDTGGLPRNLYDKIFPIMDENDRSA